MEEDCLACRLASGGGLIVASSYIYHQASSKSRLNKIGMLFISAGEIINIQTFEYLILLPPFFRLRRSWYRENI